MRQTGWSRGSLAAVKKARTWEEFQSQRVERTRKIKEKYRNSAQKPYHILVNRAEDNSTDFWGVLKQAVENVVLDSVKQSQQRYNQLVDDNTRLKSELDSLQTKYIKLQEDYDKVRNLAVESNWVDSLKKKINGQLGV